MLATVLLLPILIISIALVTFLVTRKVTSGKLREVEAELTSLRADLAAANTDFVARQEELRSSIAVAREAEKDANRRATDAELQAREVAKELHAALEEKGQLKSEAARVEEIKTSLGEKETEVESLNVRLSTLEIQKAEAVKDAEAAKKNADDLVAAERNTHKQILDSKDEQIAKLNEFIEKAREVLKTEFKALSSDALLVASAQMIKTADQLIQKHGEKTSADVKLHHQQIETMLKPVEETIKRLDKHVEDSDLARARAETLLDDQMKRLAGASEALTNALRKPVVRGSWGEMTLENALENAGLESGIDFVLQHHTDDDDEGRKRTDAIINLPKGRKLIIDSKNLMESYIALANCEDPGQKALLAEIHSKSLKNHMKALWGKEYWKRYEGLDCVILFIPHDGMYHAAIQDEAELIRDACEKRVFIANPMSLIPLLKAIRYVLDQERLNKSAEEISKVGADLYMEISRFAENFSTIGDRLKSTIKAYNDAVPGLDRYLVAKSRKLKQLGSAKGTEPEMPDTIESQPRNLSANFSFVEVDESFGRDSDT
jgi:DNA recombination protein RmuC